MIKQRLFTLVKEIAFNTPLRRYFFPRYFYGFEVPQLCFLCQCIDETKNIDGAIAEIGCASGTTTIFLNKYLDAIELEKKYLAVDTFSGFVTEDIEYESENRGKKKSLYFDAYSLNKQKWFNGTLQQNSISRVTSIEADVNEYDLKSLGPLSFCLLDVDLYRPIKKSLYELYEISTYLMASAVLVVPPVYLTLKAFIIAVLEV